MAFKESYDTSFTALSNDNAEEPASLFTTEKALAESLAPLELVQTRGSVANEVTIQQVAPLVLVLTGATFIHTVSAQSVVIILPSLSRALNINEASQQWVVSAYALTSGAFLLLAGKLADVYGKRVMFIMGCFFITASTIGAAFSPNDICIYVMRALAGLGAAVVVPTAIGIIGHTIPPGRVKNYSFAFYMGGAPTGQVVGNILGGVIAEYASWKVVFFVIAGVAAFCGIVAMFVIPNDPPRDQDGPRASSVDWIGAFLFTSGCLLLLIALSEGAALGWSTPFVIAILVVALIFVAVFLFWQYHLEKTSREPLIRVSTFRNGRFSFAMAIVFFFSAAFTNYLVYSTYYYQDYQGLSPIQTTLRFVPLGICGVLSVLCSGYLLARVRGDYLLIFGLISSIIANLLFAVPIPTTTSYFAYGMIAMCLAAFGADTLYPCLGLFVTQSLPRKDQGVGGAMFQTSAGLGRAIFLPLTATVQNKVQAHSLQKGRSYDYAFLQGLRGAEWTCVALSIICLAMTLGGLRNIGKIGLLKKLGNVQSDVKEKDEESA